MTNSFKVFAFTLGLKLPVDFGPKEGQTHLCVCVCVAQCRLLTHILTCVEVMLAKTLHLFGTCELCCAAFGHGCDNLIVCYLRLWGPLHHNCWSMVALVFGQFSGCMLLNWHMCCPCQQLLSAIIHVDLPGNCKARKKTPRMPFFVPPESRHFLRGNHGAKQKIPNLPPIKR